MAWSGVLVAQRFSWFPYFPPLSWFTVSPFVLVFLFFSFVFFFVSGVCSFHFNWASSLSVIGAMGGGGGLGARGLVAELRVGRPVGVRPPWGVIAVTAPWPLGTQPPLAMPALQNFIKCVQ